MVHSNLKPRNAASLLFKRLLNAEAACVPLPNIDPKLTQKMMTQKMTCGLIGQSENIVARGGAQLQL